MDGEVGSWDGMGWVGEGEGWRFSTFDFRPTPTYPDRRTPTNRRYLDRHTKPRTRQVEIGWRAWEDVDVRSRDGKGRGGWRNGGFRLSTFDFDLPRRTRPTNEIETAGGGNWAKGKGGRARKVVGWVR